MRVVSYKQAKAMIRRNLACSFQKEGDGGQGHDLSESSDTKLATIRTPAASACCCCSYTTGLPEATSVSSPTACDARQASCQLDLKCVEVSKLALVRTVS